MFTYELIDGGYKLLKDGVTFAIQSFNPKTGEAFLKEEAKLVAEQYILSMQNLQVQTKKLSYKDIKEKEIRSQGAKKLNEVASPYTLEERETWSIQILEANLYIKDNSSYTPLLDALCYNRGISKGDLVRKIIDNANLFTVACGTILGQQQALLDKLSALPPTATSVEIDSINWPDVINNK